MAKITHVEVVLSDNGSTETFELDNTSGWSTIIIGADAKAKAEDHAVSENLKFKPKTPAGAALEEEAVTVMTKEPDVCTWDGAKWVCSGS